MSYRTNQGTSNKHNVSIISQDIFYFRHARSFSPAINPNLKELVIRRGNASFVLGTVPHSEGLEGIFEFVTTPSQSRRRSPMDEAD